MSQRTFATDCTAWTTKRHGTASPELRIRDLQNRQISTYSKMIPPFVSGRLPETWSRLLRNRMETRHWPQESVKVSPVEGVIEAFWNPRLKTAARWTSDNGKVTASWDCCFFNMQTGPSGGSPAMSRVYRIDLGDYQWQRVRLRSGMGVRTTILAEVDGTEHEAGIHDALEIVGSICGRHVDAIDTEVRCRVVRHRWDLAPEERAGHFRNQKCDPAPLGSAGKRW